MPLFSVATACVASQSLLIGLLLGTYSSIFVAAPLLAWIKARYPDPLPEKI